MFIRSLYGFVWPNHLKPEKYNASVPLKRQCADIVFFSLTTSPGFSSVSRCAQTEFSNFLRIIAEPHIFVIDSLVYSPHSSRDFLVYSSLEVVLDTPRSLFTHFKEHAIIFSLFTSTVGYFRYLIILDLCLKKKSEWFCP
jgi:hypothetical protein